MENVRGKEVDLSRATVKIPGQYRPGRGAITSNGLLKSHLNDLSSANSRAAAQGGAPGGGAGGSESGGTMNARRSGGSTSSGVVGATGGGQDGAVILSNDSMAQGGCSLSSCDVMGLRFSPALDRSFVSRTSRWFL